MLRSGHLATAKLTQARNAVVPCAQITGWKYLGRVLHNSQVAYLFFVFNVGRA